MRPSLICLILLLWFLPLSGCYNRDNAPPAPDYPADAAVDTAIDDIENRHAEQYAADKRTASRIAAALDNRQLAAQVIITGIDGKGRLTEGMQFLLAEYPAGGIMLFRYNLDSDNDAIQHLVAEAAAIIARENTAEIDQSGVTIPPFTAVDHEGGSVNRFRTGVGDLPPAAYYGQIAREEGEKAALARITADSFNAGTIMNALGITMNFAPVAEYAHNENRDFLRNRSYGADPAFTAAAAAAFINGMEQAGILCVIKHFPGSAGADPHYFPAVLTGSKAHLAELASPFAALIQDGRARALMVSHSVVPVWDTAIASLSPAVMGGWLRQDLHYDGIIVCDDFSMSSGRQSSANLTPEAAAVLSLAAGTDMVLVWPPDLRKTHRAIINALNEGALSRERLQEAATRIIFEKIRMGIVNDA